MGIDSNYTLVSNEANGKDTAIVIILKCGYFPRVKKALNISIVRTVCPKTVLLFVRIRQPKNKILIQRIKASQTVS